MTGSATSAPTIGSEALKTVLMGAFDRLDRLPALQATLERAATLSSVAMRKGAAEPPPQLALVQLQAGVASEVLAPHEGVCIAAVVNVAQWKTRALMSADRACVSIIVELLLGSDGIQAPIEIDRAFTKIDFGIVQRYFGRIAKELETAFAPIAKSTFAVGTATDRIDFDAVGRRHASVVVARFALRIWGRSGEILLVIPRVAIDDLRQVLARVTSDEPEKGDPRWSSQIKDEITRTSVVLSGVLDERLAPLQEIADLKVGQILQLNATAASRVRVECNGEPLLWCQLGKSNGAYTLRVEEPIDRDQEFVNDILAG
jgi:flagellar motor switch protein FliM